MLHPLLQDSLEMKNLRFDLKAFSELEKKLKNPSRVISSIHVAGTNGKGTVSFKIARALSNFKKKVGLYTSPHIFSYHERIQINGVPIHENDAGRILEKIKNELGQLPSYFETLTLLAFLYFAEQNVDFAIFETGMGGRLDATNILLPLVSVITSIGLDHTRHLGKTRNAIAFEKAGIIKVKTPVVIGPKVEPVWIFKTTARQRKSPIYHVNVNAGDYDIENNAVVIKTLSLLPFYVSENAIEEANQYALPCRFQEIFHEVIFDVGHNPAALERVFEKLYLKYQRRPIRVLAAFSNDKEIKMMLQLLGKKASFVHLTQANHERTWNALSWKETISRNMEIDIDFSRSFEKGFLLAKQNNEIFLVCGTFYIMKDALAKLDWVRSVDLAIYGSKCSTDLRSF